MRETKRCRDGAMAYHHTSSLWTNLIWMSGVIEVEGVVHPHMGRITIDARLRRPMTDFPAVAWFTTRIEVPKVLMNAKLRILDQETGKVRREVVDPTIVNALALNRVTLGFRLADVDLIAWPEYRGYGTAEGRALNQTARDAGDNPEDWYVSENPVNVMKASEVWLSSSIFNPKLQRADWYLADVKRMVTMCRELKGVYIPPSWLKPEKAAELTKWLGILAVDL